MKTRFKGLFLTVFISIFFLSGCGEDEGFHQISSVERGIYLRINEFRTSSGQSSLVEQFLLFREARMVSEKIAANTYELDDPRAQQDLDEIADNLGGTSHSLLTFPAGVENADSVINFLKASAEYSEILLGEYSQCGVGFSTDIENNHYVAVMLVEIPE